MNQKPKILIVDDTEINRSLLTDILSPEYEIMEASNGVEALALINRHSNSLSLILLDIVMPEMDGFGVLSALERDGLTDSIPVIVISSDTTSDTVERTYSLGVAEYISRPFDEKIVRRRIKNVICLYSRSEKQGHEAKLTGGICNKSNLIMIELLSNIVEFRNEESGLHVLYIRLITEMLLRQLARRTDKYDLCERTIELITNASALHDIGKITISEDILNKPGRLTPQEYEIIKTHSAAGAGILEKSIYYNSEELIKTAHDICQWHHERYDGNGYPDRLAGEDIPISAQVVSISDVFDALTSKRAYKEACSPREALKMILDGECGQFNPLLIQCLCDIMPQLESILKKRSAERALYNVKYGFEPDGIKANELSGRTLTLLEQERTKYRFFASMSREIQFEYDCRDDLLTLSEWGAQRLGLNQVIEHPCEDESFKRIFPGNTAINLRKMLTCLTKEKPMLSENYLLNIGGDKRWHKLSLRPLWLSEESGEITEIIGKFSDIHKEQLELDRLKDLAMHDSLTGLYDKEYSHRLIENILEKNLKQNNLYAFILLDLDYFKNANDTYGHMFGDMVIRETAKRIKKSICSNDIAARIGGDEYLIFIEYTTDIAEKAESIFSTVNGHYNNFEINVSMGVSLSPKNGSSYDELFRYADRALYTAKQQGRRKLCYYDSSMRKIFPKMQPSEALCIDSNTGINS